MSGDIRCHYFALAFTLILVAGLPNMSRAGCAGDDMPCRLDAATDGGTYHLVLPDGQAPPNGWPAVLFLHGWGSEGAAIMRNDGMTDTLTGRGYAVIAPDGTPREGRNGRGWLFHPGNRDGRDEGAFLRGVADDAAEKFGLDRDRMVLAGFSIGGSMASYIACETPDSFSAYAPVAGSFWRPHPKECAAPVRLFHTHGWADETVPLEGRSVGGGTLAQGDVFAAMEIWRDTNLCRKPNPDSFARKGDFMIRSWTGCAAGASLVFALHPGGHTVPSGWGGMMLDWYETGDR
ncbi:alpha/beta hydrolase family esterase [Paracoccus alkanivorans]|uniref:Polyhydroxybutyrate depolymerase n=1 Tax=Paracoccus alkanivorans TaxID=2116655 RepID=A0A3M0MVU0_9RHOB|nr:PHB depolymerase family esterase [Paracoccus alkanivorans]RMC35437.1 polyhydroxybutyrate depolymerase [Paracoccus alkanivorans]